MKEGKKFNSGLVGSIKTYIKLLEFFDKESLFICLPTKNDFGDMNEQDFKDYEKKKLLVEKVDQYDKIVKQAEKLHEQKIISASAMKALKKHGK